MGAIADFEQARTLERERAGLRPARTKNKELGCLRAAVKPEQVPQCAQGRRAERSDRLLLPAVDRIYTVGEGKHVIAAPAALQSQRTPAN